MNERTISSREELDSLPAGSVVDLVAEDGTVLHTVTRVESGGAGSDGHSLLSGDRWREVANWPRTDPSGEFRGARNVIKLQR